MKLIIDIPEKDYDFTKGAKTARTYNTEYYVNLIIKGTPLEKELEKIKAEMIKNFWNGDLYETQEAFNQGVSKSILIIDNYISELKGENNG